MLNNRTKLNQLFQGLYLRIHSALIYRELIKSRVNLVAFKFLRSKYVKGAPPFRGYSRYFDIETYLKRDINRTLTLGLNKQRPLKILDLGSGMGYFLLASEFWGHLALGFDIDDSKKYRDVINFLGVKRLIGRVEAFVPLPVDHLSPFDLITAFQVTFNLLDNGAPWGIKEWDFFIQDLCAHLTPSGRIYLQLNPIYGKYYSQEVYEHFLGIGAKVNEAYVDINNASSPHLQR